MRRVLALCAVAGIATSVFAVPASAAVGYYVIRWDNTGICQVWNEDLKYKPFQWGVSTYKVVSKPLPTFTAASELQIKLRAERAARSRREATDRISKGGSRKRSALFFWTDHRFFGRRHAFSAHTL